MILDKFESHLRDPSPGFRCFACGDRTETPAFLARVKNRINRPGSAKALAGLEALFGKLPTALRRFYELHDGVLLYRDTKSNAAGVEFFKASEWQSRTNEMQESMFDMGFEESDMPDWFHQGLVFGEIPHSGNYLIIQPAGKEAGQVFYADHDSFTEGAIAASFKDLLLMIVDDPPGFMYARNCFTRYSDGKTDTQWIPKEYVSDCRSG
jgi:hypothetical protein